MHDIPFVRLLVAAAQAAVVELNDELVRRGHGDVRPSHGFALLAVGADGTTASELGSRLGMTKQGAGKLVDRLVDAGYLARTPHPRDARASLLRRTAAADDLLAASEQVQRSIEASWTTAGASPPTLVREALEAALAGRDPAPLRPLW